MDPVATARRLTARLPRGHTLPCAVWDRRHRWMIRVLWAHVAGLLVFAVARGFAVQHGLLDVSAPALAAAAAASARFPRRPRAALVVMGLLTCSAVLVHLWGGRIEGHFHFFVMVTLLSLYEEWSTYLLAFAFVLVHHTVGGLIEPHSVFDHPGGWHSPLLWAGIHALFIAGLGVVNVICWRLNEDARLETVASEGRFRSAFDDAPTGMAMVDLDGVISRVNDTFCARTGFPADELIGRPLDDLTPPEDRDGRPWPRVERGVREIERRFVRRDGSIGWALWQHSMTRDLEGQPAAYVSHCLDISLRKRAEDALSWQAHHDPLTGLPNRKLFVERLEDALERRTAPGGGRVAVLFVDLDNFKIVNDSLGHRAGDRLLEAVAERLRRVLRPEDVIARFGGDEFTVLLANVHDERHALRVADRLASALRAPLVLDGEQRFITASVGLSLAEPDDARAEPQALLRDADAAMYRAKELGKARCEVFDDSMRKRAVERLELESALRGAEERGELRLLYQPQVTLPDGRITGVEALLRWEHPKHGLIPPLRFIPIAEQTGVILPMGAWVLREACRQAAAWGDPDLVMSVNVSPRQLGAPDFVAVVAQALEETGLAPERLCLEITESAVLADADAALLMLRELKALGLRLAIDDFGVGHASLRHLRQLLPVDTLKIDKSFVDGILSDEEDSAIVEAVVRLAHSLGLEAVAEGVEHPQQAERLSGMDCQAAQGYHFARPLPAGEIGRLLRARAGGR
ncbi:MAG TPA: EAL domain-containing protein [Solirubrobacteraceae bacterium]